jgi:hypothetical protein
MQRYIQNLTMVCLFTVVYNQTQAQGCSDAGFCSIGALRQQHSRDTIKTKQQLGFSTATGLGDENVLVITPALQYDYFSKSGYQLQARVTANYANGNLGNTFKPGDVYLSATRHFKTRTVRWAFTLGTKLPFNQADAKAGNRPLPMQYQSSLGTVDVIGGIHAEIQSWQFAAGVQLPLTGRNRNGFLPAYWPGNEKAAAYPSTLDFDRKPDVLLRAAYALPTKGKLKLSAGALAIYHLGKDTYINANISNRPIAIEGSDGLTLNVTASLQYELNKKLRFSLMGGTPVAVRDVRPDGLTRSFVLTPELTWTF